MAEPVGLAASVVCLLNAVLKVVDFISSARDDCKDAPRLTLLLVDKVDSAKLVLVSIKDTIARNPVPEERWDDLKPNLLKLSAVVEVAGEDVALYIQKDEKRKNAGRALEVLKASFKGGASKQKKATEGSLGQIDQCLNALRDLVHAHVLKIVCELHSSSGESKLISNNWGQALLLKLQNKADMCMANDLLKHIIVEVEGEGEKYSSPTPNQQVRVLQVEENCIRGRVSGTQVRNSTKIRFTLEVPGVDKWFFHVLTCDLHDKTSSPKLFFPKNLKAHDNTLIAGSGTPRKFPYKQLFGRFQFDPDGLTLDRSEGIPADGDSPWSIFIVITSERLLPKGEISKIPLTIEDIAAVLDQDDTVLVKQFLFDIMKQADGGSTSTSR